MQRKRCSPDMTPLYNTTTRKTRTRKQLAFSVLGAFLSASHCSPSVVERLLLTGHNRTRRPPTKRNKK